MAERSGAVTDPDAVGGDPRLRLAVAALVALEAAVLVGLAVFVGVETVVASPTDVAGSLALAAVTLVIGVGLGLCARGVLAARRWSKAPVITWQLLQAGIAMPLSSSARWYIGIPLLAVAIVVGVLMAGNKVVPRDAS